MAGPHCSWPSTPFFGPYPLCSCCSPCACEPNAPSRQRIAPKTRHPSSILRACKPFSQPFFSPLVHFTGYLTGLLRESQRRPRELLLMALLAILGFMAMAQHRRSHQRARDLARRKAVTASALAKNQASLRLIQERRRTQEELRRAEERNGAIFRASPSGLLLCDLPSGIVREVNQNLERLCARPKEDLLEKSLETLGLWNDPMFHAELEQRLRDGQRIYREPLDLRLADGSPRSVRLSAELLEGQEPPSLLLVLRDRESRDDTLASVPEIARLSTLTLLLDENDTVRATSATAADRLGLPMAELLGRPLDQLPLPPRV